MGNYTIKSLLLLAMLLSSFLAPKSASALASEARTSDSLIRYQHDLEQEGKEFEKSGNMNLAAERYKQAADLDIKIYGSNKGRPLAFLAEVYEKQGRYEEALSIAKSLLEYHPTQENYQDWIPELEVLLQYQKTNNSKLVLSYVASYISKHQDGLPPKHFSIDAPLKITRILALYDKISAYDEGIRYIDSILDYLYRTHPQIIRHANSAEATLHIDRLTKAKNNADAYSYRILREFMLAREAFEQDKKDGSSGRVQKALIQSEYFPF